MPSKIWTSAIIDFVVTAGTAYLALNEQGRIFQWNVIVIPLIGGTVAAAKGMSTYYATHPSKIERDDPRYHDNDTN